MKRLGLLLTLAIFVVGSGRVFAEVGQGHDSAARQPTLLVAPNFTPAEFARALLAETNRVRQANFRRPLKASRELEAAADDQAAFMALRLQVQHGSLLRGQATAEERVRRHGLEGVAVGENVASMITGDASDAMSVREIATQLVEQWMNSPGHRANLLDARFTHFGGSVRLSRLHTGQWAAYGTQVFLIARPRFGRLST